MGSDFTVSAASAEGKTFSKVEKGFQSCENQDVGQATDPRHVRSALKLVCRHYSCDFSFRKGAPTAAAESESILAL
jgi:hypothetical protein